MDLRQRMHRSWNFERGFGKLDRCRYYFVYCRHHAHLKSPSYSDFPNLSSGLCRSRWRMLFVLVTYLLLLVLSTFLQTVLQTLTRIFCSTFVVVK